MASREVKMTFIPIGVLLLPVIAVKIAAVLLGNSPTTAQGQTLAPAIQPVAEGRKPRKPHVIDAKQIAAAKYAETLKQQPFGASPLLMPAIVENHPEQAPDTLITSETAPSPERSDDPPTYKFVVNAIMSSASGQRALINGRPYSIGETIRGTSWTIRQIDSASRSVTLADDSSDATMTISVELPR